MLKRKPLKFVFNSNSVKKYQIYSELNIFKFYVKPLLFTLPQGKAFDKRNSCLSRQTICFL